MPRPNLFRYAASELAQDAFFCWLFLWANPEYADVVLHGAANEMLGALLGLHGRTLPPGAIVEVDRQYFRIDIRVRITDPAGGRLVVLLIEDKVNADGLLNPFDEYLRKAREDMARLNPEILPIYLRTRDEHSAATNAVAERGWKAFLRRDVASVLGKHRIGINSAIYGDFCEMLDEEAARIDAYLTTPPSDWDRWAWRGFFQWLEARRPGVAWRRTNNKNDGFESCWWGDAKFADCDAYLQIEEGPLCFKIVVPEDDNAKRTQARDGFGTALVAQYGELQGPPFRTGIRTRHRRLGNWMTAARIEREDWLQVGDKGCVDLDATLAKLAIAEQLLVDSAR